MPRKCSVLACQFSKNENVSYSTFRFPSRKKYPETFEIWLKFAHLKEHELSDSSSICSGHFQPLCFTNNPTRNTLKPGSIPTIHSSNGNMLYKSSFSREHASTSHAQHQSVSFTDIRNFFETNLHCFTNFEIKTLDNSDILLYILESVPPFNNIFAIHISSNKSVRFYSCGKEIERKVFCAFFSKPYFISSLSDFSSLVSFCNENYLSIVKNPSSEIFDIESTILNIKNRFPGCDFLINLLFNQLLLTDVAPQKRRYDPDLILFAFSIFSKSRSAYQTVCKFLALPTIRSLQNYSLPLNLSVKSDSCNLDYLKTQFQHLQNHEKYVSLKIDEIQLKPKLELRGGSLEGFSENRPEELAHHVQAFMINSLRSKYKEMVKLVPVNRNTASSLLENLNAIIDLVESIGFVIVCVTSDNNRINRNCFDKLLNGKNQHFFDSKVHPGSKIFLLFDAPNMIKCIRNNWINLRTQNQDFNFPPFQAESFGANAQFKHLKDLYHYEKDKNIKLGFKLNFNSIYPSSIHRQKVPLALKVFDETTISALNVLIAESDGTQNFLKLFGKFWKIFNISDPKKGYFKNDPESMPFKSLDDERLLFLIELANWLDCWKSHPSPGKLSSETFHSVSFSCRSLVELVKYLLGQLDFKYVLTAKLQTDCLESMFGIYRQMNGSSMLLSWFQILSAEKKVRVMNSLSLRGEIFGINDTDFSNPSKDILIDFYRMKVDFDSFDSFETEEIEACVYIGGYILKKYTEHASCEECGVIFGSQICKDEIEELNTQYLENIDRGKMKYPTPLLINLILVCQRYFNVYLEPIIKESNQQINVPTVLNHFMNLLSELDLVGELNVCSIHPENLNKNLEFCCGKIARLILNNFSKKIVDSLMETKGNLNKRSRNTQIDKFYM